MIVLGASHDNGYANILSSLSTENRLSRLLLLKGYSDLAGQLRQYSSRVVTIPDLFRTSKIPMSFSSVASAAKDKAVKKAVPKAVAAAAAAAAASKSSIGSDEDTDDGATRSSVTATTDVIEWGTAGKAKAKPAAAPTKGPKKEAFKNKSKDKAKRKGWTVRELDPRPCHT